VLVAVVSDTHRDSHSIEKILKKVNHAEVLIHLGDNDSDAEEIARKFKGRVISVRGNCDFGSSTESELVEEIGGVRFFITHGHRYDVKYGLTRLMFKAQEVNAEVVLFGHTHIALIERGQGIWFLNPGSASESRRGSESMAFIDIAADGIRPSIVEL
jgi:putative phosphoesterase